MNALIFSTELCNWHQKSRTTLHTSVKKLQLAATWLCAFSRAQSCDELLLALRGVELCCDWLW